MPYSQNGRNRTAVSADRVQPFRVVVHVKRRIPTDAGLSRAAAWKPRRHVASSLESRSFNEGGPRAAKEIIHAPDHRGPAAECAGTQPSADCPERRHQRLDGAELPRTCTACQAQLA